MGWQLEREAANGEYDNSGDEDDKKYEIDSDGDELPFKCFICRDRFVDPIVTKFVHFESQRFLKKKKNIFTLGKDREFVHFKFQMQALLL